MKLPPLIAALFPPRTFGIIAAILLGSTAPVIARDYSWTNFVGLPGGSGNVDGTGAAARFAYPAGATAGPDGNYYVADRNNYTIRKVTPAGVVTTLAGQAGLSGSTDGTGNVARFYSLEGIAAGADGKLYVADGTSVRRVTLAGEVTTLAGQPYNQGTSDGSGITARFRYIRGISAGSDGHLYTVDFSSHTIRKITLAGVVSTLAGQPETSGSDDGVGSAARFNAPVGIAAGSDGVLYVSEYYNQTIRKVTLAGVVSTLAGQAGSTGSADGIGGIARFRYPIGMASGSDGNLYVVDSYNHTIRKVTLAGVVSTLAGQAGSSGSIDGTGTVARFSNPYWIASGPDGGLCVSESNHILRHVSLAGVVTTLAGQPPASGSSDGNGASSRLFSPQDITFASDGNFYVADTNNRTIRKVTSAGVMTTLAGQAGYSSATDATGSAARFYQPRQLASDGSGNLYVVDGNAIRQVTLGGVVTTIAGDVYASGSADGTASAARFYGPVGITLGADGHLYVADTYNRTIRKVTVTGEVTTLAGQAGEFGHQDATGSVARFAESRGIAAGSDGNLYVTDQSSRTVRRVTLAGEVTTLAGQPWSSGMRMAQAARRVLIYWATLPLTPLATSI